jgi:hypothetical protein
MVLVKEPAIISIIVKSCTCNACGKAFTTTVNVSELIIAVNDTLAKSDNYEFIVSVLIHIKAAPNTLICRINCSILMSTPVASSLMMIQSK